TLAGKSAVPENPRLSLGTGAGVMPLTVHEFLAKADVVFGIGCSFTRHSIVAAPIPPGKIIIHATNDERDRNKHYSTDYPILGDAKSVLRQLIEALKDIQGTNDPKRNGAVATGIRRRREPLLCQWMPKRTSKEVPI